MIASPERQLEVIRRGSVDLVTPDEWLRKIRLGRPLVIKVGFDPTAPDLHLGHTVVMRKMRQLQDLGHHVVFVIGDFTGAIGDPTGRTKTRPALEREVILKNAETYRAQALKVLDPGQTEIRFNSEWLGPLDAHALVKLAAQYTVARMLERDDFSKRYAENRPISVHEFLYPLFQAYDSVALKADVEMGGQDQLFNLLVGREVMKGYGLEPQVVLTVPVLEGTDAREVDGRIVGDKMSKSLGNYVALDDPADEMFGKLMSIPDLLMWRYYELLSALELEDIRSRRAAVTGGSLHPREAKARLAAEIVERYHGAAAAVAAGERFDKVHRAHEVPEDVPQVTLEAAGLMRLAKVCAAAGLAASATEAQRLIQQGAVAVDGVKATDKDAVLASGAVYLLQVGKRRFARVTLGAAAEKAK